MPGMANMPNAQLLSEGISQWLDGRGLGRLLESSSTPQYYLLYTREKERGFCLLDPTGALRENGETIAEGELEGPSRTYAPHTGIILEETIIPQALKHGKHTKWYANRTLQEQGN